MKNNKPGLPKTLFHIVDNKRAAVLKIEKSANGTYLFTVRDRSISLSVEYMERLREILDKELL